MTDLDQLIKDELLEWKKLGIAEPAEAISSNSFIDSVRISSLTKLLLHKGLVEETDMEFFFKKQMIESLQEARKGLNKARMEHITRGITHQ